LVKKQEPALADDFSYLETLIPRLLSEWNVPGAAVAVVKGSESGGARVVFARGFGEREAGRPGAVDEHTLFAIGSLTKAFTAAAVGLLVREGRLGWDAPVIEILPGFQLFDPLATREITVRDLLCHRSGLGTWAGDWIWYGSRYTVAEVVRRARHVEPAFRLGAGYGYSNLAYIAAGQVIESAAGVGFEAFIRERFFQPLGMERSTFSIQDLPGMGNVAIPHQVFEGLLQGLPYRIEANCAAPGGIVASAWDVAQWLGCLINRGKAGATTILSEETLDTLWTPHNLQSVPAQTRRLNPLRHFAAYGLGWSLSDNRGRLVVSHTGGIDGMQALTLLLPEEQAGMAILTNRIPHYLSAVLSQTFIDRLAGAPENDWNAVFRELDSKEADRLAEARRKQTETRAAGTRPSLQLSAYAGAYHNPAIGDLTVREADGGLALILDGYPGLRGLLEHWHYDTFLCRWSDPCFGECLAPFQLDATGAVESFRVQVDPFIDPLSYRFTRAR
jgi:CubicO group peptidase (beta-lactamase class C family)